MENAMIRKIIRQKPHRLPREYYRGEIWASYTACVQDRHFLFAKHKIVDSFVSMLDYARKRNDCIVLLYCFRLTEKNSYPNLALTFL
jgi:hypothetical protein